MGRQRQVRGLDAPRVKIRQRPLESRPQEAAAVGGPRLREVHRQQTPASSHAVLPQRVGGKRRRARPLQHRVRAGLPQEVPGRVTEVEVVIEHRGAEERDGGVWLLPLRGAVFSRPLDGKLDDTLALERQSAAQPSRTEPGIGLRLEVETNLSWYVGRAGSLARVGDTGSCRHSHRLLELGSRNEANHAARRPRPARFVAELVEKAWEQALHESFQLRALSGDGKGEALETDPCRVLGAAFPPVRK